jgi:hypothetical protein
MEWCAYHPRKSIYARRIVEKRGTDTHKGLSGPVKAGQVESWEMVLKILCVPPTTLLRSLALEITYTTHHNKSAKIANGATK